MNSTRKRRSLLDAIVQTPKTEKANIAAHYRSFLKPHTMGTAPNTTTNAATTWPVPEAEVSRYPSTSPQAKTPAANSRTNSIRHSLFIMVLRMPVARQC